MQVANHMQPICFKGNVQALLQRCKYSVQLHLAETDRPANYQDPFWDLEEAMAQPRHRREGQSLCSQLLVLSLNPQELGLHISDAAIEQMKANLDLDEHQMRIAAEEEKKRRRMSLI